MKEKINLHNPNRRAGFRVPDGYFENLTQQVMERLPEAEPLSATPEKQPFAIESQINEAQPSTVEQLTVAEPTLWQRVRPWLYMAAMFAGAALIIRVASPTGEEKAAALAHEEAESQEIEYIENSLDAAMLDDYSLYIYLAEDTNH